MARDSLNPGVIWQLAATGPSGPTGPLGGALSLGTLTAAAVIGATILTVVLVLLGMRAARRLDRQRSQDDAVTQLARTNEQEHPEEYDSLGQQPPRPPARSAMATRTPRQGGIP